MWFIGEPQRLDGASGFGTLKERARFKDWQAQRDIRRKVRAETRLMLLGEFKDHKNKIDDLTEGVFTALEGIR